MNRKCESCGNGRFFVDTLGIEHCSTCYMPTMIITKATGRLSYEQIELEQDIEKSFKIKTGDKHENKI